MNSSTNNCRNLQRQFGVKAASGQFVIALAGNPNVGKSTIFNALTGLRQHTGNWPGKTVDNAQGTFLYENRSFLLVDLPGTYSLLSSSTEESIACRFICCAAPDAVLVVLDASCLERNLNLALQIMEITPKVVVCVNLLDEAARKGIAVNLPALSGELGVPVVGTSARSGQGLTTLKQTLLKAAAAGNPAPRQIKYRTVINEAVAELLPYIETPPNSSISKQWLAMRLLEGNTGLYQAVFNGGQL